MNKTIVITAFLSGILCGAIPAAVVKAFGKEYLTPSTAQPLLNTLIQVDITLVGFFGVIFVYFLKSTEDYRALLFKTMLNIEDKIEKAGVSANELSELDKLRLQRHQKRLLMFSGLVKECNKVLRNFAYLGVLVVICFMTSILLCIVSFGRIEEIGLNSDWIVLPLASMFFGIFYIFCGIWMSVPEKPADTAEEKKKLDS